VGAQAPAGSPGRETGTQAGGRGLPAGGAERIRSPLGSGATRGEVVSRSCRALAVGFPATRGVAPCRGRG